MSSSESHTIRNGIIIAVVSALIIGIATSVLGFIPIIFKWLTGIWFLISSTSITIPLWVLLILGILSLSTIYRIFRPIFHRKSNEPSLLKYNQDIFFGVVWRWSYNYDDEPILDTINCFCPQCDTRLVYSKEGFAHETKLHVLCETCQQKITSFDTDEVSRVRAKVARQIDRKIRSSEWKSVVGKK